MTDGIGRIFGGNSYGVGGYFPQKHEETKNDVPQAPVQNYEETQVDPTKVMDFLANNIFVAPKTTTPVELDPEAQDRIGNYMEQFENYYALIAEEFGDENAPMVMDLVMDKLMGMVA